MADTPSSPPVEQYGDLVVLSKHRTPMYGKSLAMCIAKCLLCGSVKEYRLNNLRTGHTTTCGCKNRLPDITGQRFASLTVVSRNDDGSYQCRCDCGKIVKSVRAPRLTSGHMQSCGCKKSGEANARYLIGKRFGRLTVLERTAEREASKSHNYLYLCRCDCGNTKLATSSELKKGNVMSCGCANTERIQMMHDTLDKTRVDNTQLVRLATLTISKNNTSGVRGVYWVARKNRWTAIIGVQKRVIRLGYFKTLEEAAFARRQAEIEYYDPLLEKHGIEPPNRPMPNKAGDVEAKKRGKKKT